MKLKKYKLKFKTMRIVVGRQTRVDHNQLANKG